MNIKSRLAPEEQQVFEYWFVKAYRGAVSAYAAVRNLLMFMGYSDADIVRVLENAKAEDVGENDTDVSE